MSAQGRIELSVVTVTPSDLAAIEGAVAALRAQTARESIELIVVAPGDCPSDGALAGFADPRVLSVGPLPTLGQAIASGVLAASGPVVAYAEEHSHPEPDWAAALIERHRGPWAAVGWSVKNANPATAASWAHLLTDFGPGTAPVASGERSRPMPWHHVSYKRDELVRYGEELGDMIEAEGVLQENLLAAGKRLFMEGGVSSRHLNISLIRFNLRSHLLGGRGYASARCRYGGWSLPRRLAYAAGFPLVPVIRFIRLRPDLARTRAVRGPVPGLLPLLGLFLAVDALGEAIGYVFGSSGSRRRRIPMELERASYLRAGDTAIADPGPVQAEAVSETVSVSSR